MKTSRWRSPASPRRRRRCCRCPPGRRLRSPWRGAASGAAHPQRGGVRSAGGDDVSSLTAERLYALLPAVYRIRDEQQGHPLRALVSLMAREFETLEENIEQLYDDQFIETCEN